MGPTADLRNSARSLWRMALHLRRALETDAAFSITLRDSIRMTRRLDGICAQVERLLRDVPQEEPSND